MDDKHPLQELANDPGLAEAMQDAMRLGIRFDEMVTALRAITGQSETDAIRDLENAMGTLIVRKMRKKDVGELYDPDLLSACEGALFMLDALFPAHIFTGESGDEGPELIAKNRERLQAAIAKARGE